MAISFTNSGPEMLTTSQRVFCGCGRERMSAGVAGGGGEHKADSGELTLYSPLRVVILVALMCGMLVLMYFFYNILGKLESAH